jgi:hypothetical protein
MYNNVSVYFLFFTTNDFYNFNLVQHKTNFYFFVAALYVEKSKEEAYRIVSWLV